MDEYSEEAESVEEEPVDEAALFFEEEIKECFAVFDPKNKGEMPSKFLEKALRSLGLDLTSTEIEDILEQYNIEGHFKFQDFERCAMEKLKDTQPYDLLKSSFTVFDTEEDGIIRTDRFKKWMTTLGDPLTDAEAKELCKLADPSNKGTFTPNEIIPLLAY